MSLEPIGIVTLALGMLCLALGQHAAAIAFLIASLFGAAAAIIIGAANIQPGHVVLGFAALAALTRRRELAGALQSLTPFRPGFWLACLVLYGVFSAAILPRLFAGATDIIPLGSSAFDDTGGVVPLGPVSSNFTQSVYMLANLLCFLTIAAIAATLSGFRAVVIGLCAYAAGNAAMALIDLASHATGTHHLLGFMRNAQYTLHVDTEIHGMKRIVGSFTEASSFARSTLGALGLTGVLFLAGIRPALTGALSLLLLALVVLSTSSTGLAGAPLMLALLYGVALARSLHGRPGLPARPIAASVAVAGPLLALTAGLALALSPAAMGAVMDYLGVVLLDKPQSGSAIERGHWNAVAFQNILDTWGVGIGLGTGRASSFVLALVSNVGVIGTLFYLAFLATLLLPALADWLRSSGSFHAEARLAACVGCLGLLLGDLMISPVIDQGLFFYALAALAASRPEMAAGPRRTRSARAQPVPAFMLEARHAGILRRDGGAPVGERRP